MLQYTQTCERQDVPVVCQDVLGDLSMKTFFSILALLLFLPCFARASVPSDRLIAALIEHESGGDDNEIGDTDLKNKAYGCLQIRQPCVDDVNEAFGTNYRAKDCLGNRELSIWIFRRYMELWATEKRIGRKPTDEDCARIWNGGPNGWKKKTTLKYWVKIKRIMDLS